MAANYAKINRVGSLDTGFQQVPIVQNNEIFTYCYGTSVI